MHPNLQLCPRCLPRWTAAWRRWGRTVNEALKVDLAGLALDPKGQKVTSTLGGGGVLFRLGDSALFEVTNNRLVARACLKTSKTNIQPVAWMKPRNIIGFRLRNRFNGPKKSRLQPIDLYYLSFLAARISLQGTQISNFKSFFQSVKLFNSPFGLPSFNPFFCSLF